MRALITSIVILCLIITSIVTVSIHTVNLLENLKSIADERLSDNCPESLIGINEVNKEFEEIKPFLRLFVCDSEVRELELYISDVKSAAEKDNSSELVASKNRLTLHIDQLRRLSAFSIEAIL